VRKIRMRPSLVRLTALSTLLGGVLLASAGFSGPAAAHDTRAPSVTQQVAPQRSMPEGFASWRAAASAARPDPTAASDAAVLKEVARVKATGLRVATPPPSRWTVDTGTDDTWNGACTASTHADYYPANDQAQMATTVSSPYLFAACRVNAQLWIETRAGSFPSAVNYAMACAVWDPTCASTQTWPGNYYGATPSLTAFVESVNDALEAAGLPRTYTRAAAITGVRVIHSTAS